MNNVWEEYMRIKNEEAKLEEEYDRDVALSCIPAILIPGPGAIISSILIWNRFIKFEKDVENI